MLKANEGADAAIQRLQMYVQLLARVIGIRFNKHIYQANATVVAT